MSLLLVAIAIALCGGSGLASLTRAGDRGANALFVLGCATGLLGAALGFSSPSHWTVPWAAPLGAVRLEVDPLSAMFLVQVFVIGAAGSVYGLGYWPAGARGATALRLAWGGVCAGLGIVFVARHGLAFLMGWELMALSGWAALTADDRDPRVREAGLLYLFCTHAATLLLFALFAGMRAESGSFELAPRAGAPTAALALALLGFGLKAGVMPLHVWLPSAHGSAPSHVSALLSGVVIKAGIYGIVRVLWMYPEAPIWWGEALLALGGVSAVLGVVLAIGQHDLKRLLAYHSVENIGIILLGLGLFAVGRATGEPDLAALGLAGALLHTWNHGLFKSLLFLSAGAVLHATGERDTDRLGGLARRMPRTSAAFLLGAVAICGLPPLNGFVSELLVYVGFVRTLDAGGRTWLMAAVGAPALAMTGGLAALCFAKVYGAVFLGAPRTEAAERAHPASLLLVGPMAALAACCAFIGIFPAAVAPLLDRAVDVVVPGHAPLATLAPFAAVSGTAALLLGLVALGAWALRGTPATRAPTWDCGYAAPTARMQYGASSFAQPTASLWGWALLPQAQRVRARGIFPEGGLFRSHATDAVLDWLLLPLVRRAVAAADALRGLQRGTMQWSLLWLLIPLLLAWGIS